jgi:hypothetical protein
MILDPRVTLARKLVHAPGLALAITQRSDTQLEPRLAASSGKQNIA